MFSKFEFFFMVDAQRGFSSNMDTIDAYSCLLWLSFTIHKHTLFSFFFFLKSYSYIFLLMQCIRRYIYTPLQKYNLSTYLGLYTGNQYTNRPPTTRYLNENSNKSTMILDKVCKRLAGMCSSRLESQNIGSIVKFMLATSSLSSYQKRR